VDAPTLTAIARLSKAIVDDTKRTTLTGIVTTTQNTKLQPVLKDIPASGTDPVKEPADTLKTAMRALQGFHDAVRTGLSGEAISSEEQTKFTARPQAVADQEAMVQSAKAMVVDKIGAAERAAVAEMNIHLKLDEENDYLRRQQNVVDRKQTAAKPIPVTPEEDDAIKRSQDPIEGLQADREKTEGETARANKALEKAKAGVTAETAKLAAEKTALTTAKAELDAAVSAEQRMLSVVSETVSSVLTRALKARTAAIKRFENAIVVLNSATEAPAQVAPVPPPAPTAAVSLPGQ
jgi:hypothetical protein